MACGRVAGDKLRRALVLLDRKRAPGRNQAVGRMHSRLALLIFLPATCNPAIGPCSQLRVTVFSLCQPSRRQVPPFILRRRPSRQKRLAARWRCRDRAFSGLHAAPEQRCSLSRLFSSSRHGPKSAAGWGRHVLPHRPGKCRLGVSRPPSLLPSTNRLAVLTKAALFRAVAIML